MSPNSLLEINSLTVELRTPAGWVVERGSAEQALRAPLHVYTLELLAAVLDAARAN